MPYNKDDEKVLHTKEIPDYDGKPEWGGSVLEAVQYLDKKPNVVLKRYRVSKDTGEKSVVPFVTIP